MFMVVLGAIGAFYGAETGLSWLRDAVGALFYGFFAPPLERL
jgi:hypothetical protein